MIDDRNLLSGVCGYFMQISHLAFMSMTTESNGAN